MRSLRLFLTGLFFFYPFFWFSLSFLDLFPKLFSLLFRGFKIESVNLHIWMLSLAIRPPEHGSAFHRGPWLRELRTDGLNLALFLIFLLLLTRAKLSRRLPAALATAFFGWMAFLWIALEPVFGRKSTWPGAVFAAMFFLSMCLGLRWVVASAPQDRLLSRLATPITLFFLPVVCFSVILALISTDSIYKPLGLAIGSLACGALLACAVPLRRQNHSPDPLRWTLPVSGLAATLLLAASVYAGGQAVSRAHARAARAVLEALPPIPANLPFEKIYFHKGVNFTAEYPAVYGSEAALEMLRRLPSYGVTSIALVPYAGASRKEPRIQRWENGWEREDGIRQLSRLAHSLGMKVMLKPQLWVEPGNPMDLDFPQPAARARWFTVYRENLEHYARLATEIHADVFCIGVELEKMSPYDADWRRLIARTRELYPGALTYAANFGCEFESITFWDALDYMGLDEYYPLPDDLSTHDVLRRVEAVQQKFSRPVLLTEAGFPSVEGANLKPWDDPPAKPDPDLQARAYEAIFRAFYEKPWFKGMYWWKVETNGSGGPDDTSHTPWRKPAMEVVRRWYTGQAGQRTD